MDVIADSKINLINRCIIQTMKMIPLINYQLAFVTPGISPFKAISLNVTRDTPN